MKRKVKLFSSILSLTMAMSFLVLGVFATVDRTLGLGGSIVFEIDDVKAKIVVEQRYGEADYAPLDNDFDGEVELDDENQSVPAMQLGTKVVDPETDEVSYQIKFSKDVTMYSFKVEITNMFITARKQVLVTVDDAALQGIKNLKDAGKSYFEVETSFENEKAPNANGKYVLAPFDMSNLLSSSTMSFIYTIKILPDFAPNKITGLAINVSFTLERGESVGA